MTNITAEYTITVQISDLELPPNTSRVDVEKKLKEIGKKRINACLNNTAFDPTGKIFTEGIKLKMEQ